MSIREDQPKPTTVRNVTDYHDNKILTTIGVIGRTTDPETGYAAIADSEGKLTLRLVSHPSLSPNLLQQIPDDLLVSAERAERNRQRGSRQRHVQRLTKLQRLRHEANQTTLVASAAIVALGVFIGISTFNAREAISQKWTELISQGSSHPPLAR